jgi:predicted O-methyltransferase YrrM
MEKMNGRRAVRDCGSRRSGGLAMTVTVASLIVFWAVGVAFARADEGRTGLDARVWEFLETARSSWSDWNVPYVDGRILYDLVAKGGYKRILEIGTSTGHSTIWLAWAASKTGGKVTTIEIDERRFRTAQANFEKAGVAPYIDARLGDAHDLVQTLSGPFDFIFSDADKNWYLQYFRDLAPKLRVGGCFAAHNVLWGDDPGISAFVDYVRRDKKFRTTIEKGSGEGISISYKTAE